MSSWREVTLKPHIEVGMISDANEIPPMLTPEVIEGDVQDNKDDEMAHSKSVQVNMSESKPKQIKADPEEILQKVDLSETTDWDSAEQQDVYNLICEYACIFSWNDLDFGKTLMVKHSIKLTDPTPFKECYWHISPGMYEEVKAQIQDMFDIHVIHPSNNPWASVVVLVWKKDRKL